MSITNGTVFMPSVLTFIGIPGLETVQCWIGIPFCANTSIVPKMLGIFWFHLPEIYSDACLFQMWLIHTFQGIESGVLLAMALDRYIAIYYPLRHATVFTQQLVTHVGVGVTLWPAILVNPCLLLIKCLLKLYQTRLISYT
ncbi:hypothetical protein HPG69_005703 [Diceros bicornis minor]|uniref:G-protein coupled receptors family 1 profile domain-containing protein n=1 Tax=Diceros bicornis minor TaxID=77932 RepID=A0A7J7ESM3_DICBM|nr:hypothetical protein HPG69_005703 [Diceros bicornis minor]